jgi:chemotaxis protein CheD
MTVEVRIGQYVASRSRQTTLQTSSLGSCVAVALYDHQTGVAGLCHILLDRQWRFGHGLPPGRCADSAIPALISDMEALGATPDRLVAYVAGGGNMLESVPSPVHDVGTWNAQAVREVLAALGVPIAMEDVGGRWPRRLRIDVSTGKVTISRLAERDES